MARARNSTPATKTVQATAIEGSGAYSAVAVLDRPTPQPALPLSPAVRAQQGVSLKQRIAPHLAGMLDVAVTDNRSIMLSVRRDARHRRYRVRLHHLFVHAPTPIIEALSRYIAVNDRDASKQLNRFIEENDHRVDRRQRPRRVIVRSQGKVHDLQQLFGELNDKYFEGRVGSRITWGRHAHRQRPRASIRLGSFCVEEDLIRIHPGLDQGWVPLHYLQWVVYHEMLHAVHPIPMVNGKRRFHTPAFLRDERKFEHFETSRSWERRNIAALLCI